MRYAAGMDGGGTKTMLEVRKEDGTFVLREQFGPINLNGTDRKTVKETIQSCIDALKGLDGGLEACGAICAGSAGMSNPEMKAVLEDMFRECGYQGILITLGDHETALAGALEASPGIILIAGTGSICFGKNSSGETARSGGYGHLISDGGSGYAIGRDGLAAAVHSYDGSGKQTSLLEAVFSYLNISDIRQLIQYVYGEDADKKRVAKMAEVVFQEAEAGDAVAIEILAQEAKALAKLVVPVAEKLGLEKERIAFLGGVMNNKCMEENVTRVIKQYYPKMQVVSPKCDAAAGAVLLALEMIKTGGN